VISTTTRPVGRYPVAVEDITVGPRLRQPHEETIAAIAEAMQRDAPIPAVILTTGGRLVAGAHRLAAAQRVGRIQIDADVRDLDGPSAELVEIEENLCRADLSYLEQAEHLMRRREILAGMGILAGAGNPSQRAADGTFGSNPAADAGLVTTASIGREAGLSERSTRQRFQVASMPQAVRDLVRPTPVAESLHDLVALAIMPQAEQAAVARKIADGCRTVAEAQRTIAPEPSPEAAADEIAADIPERLNAVWVEIRVEFRVPSRQTRKRGDKVYLRESEDAVHVIQVNLDGALREQGDEGLRTALSQAAGKAFHDEALVADWKLLPPVGTREVAGSPDAER
jgi:ParB family chromosome partitioning protein